MARSRDKSAFAFPAEVARYLEVEPDDVKRMIKLDALPVSKLPMKTRTVQRIPLRDFHRWLIGRSAGDTSHLADFNTWRTDFLAASSPESAPPAESKAA